MSDPILIEKPQPCHDCSVEPGWTHQGGCDVERCSHCGGQWISCGCVEHEPAKSFWTGYWPGDEACRILKVDLNTLAVMAMTRHWPLRPEAERLR